MHLIIFILIINNLILKTFLINSNNDSLFDTFIYEIIQLTGSMITAIIHK